MYLTLALLAAATSPTLPNLNFSAGNLKSWQGEGFGLKKDRVSSADTGGKGRKALLHRTFTVPANASEINFSAALIRPTGVAAGGKLEVVLEAAGRRYLPRRVRVDGRWVAAPVLLDAHNGKLRQYRWDVSKHKGKRVRLALIDSDDRPGCHVVCTGFNLLSNDEVNARGFAAMCRRLERDYKLRKMVRYNTSHFMAMSNAAEPQTQSRLANCESIYRSFFNHFRKQGFEVRTPDEKLMVCIFSSQGGFEAYLGQRYSSAVTGLYHPASNRLVVYDFATNRDFREGKKRLADEAKRGSDLEQQRKTAAFGRFMRDQRDDINLSTMMHEVAHQLSFNTGLMNRTGDMPVWLAEGLAVYCESSVAGAWQGIGKSNPRRAATLAVQVKAKAGFIPLRNLVENDDWIYKATQVEAVVLGYSQSWALFRLLMEERPKKLKAYLKAIHTRRTPEQRLSDFIAAFGSLAKLEPRYQAFLLEIVKDEVKPR